MYSKLVTKVNKIDTSGFVSKTECKTEKSDLKEKIIYADKKVSDTNGLVKNTDYNAKVSEIESKIPRISGSATTSALTAVGNKILELSSLVKKADRNTKIVGTEKKVKDHNHDKYTTTPDFNNLAAGFLLQG